MKKIIVIRAAIFLIGVVLTSSIFAIDLFPTTNNVEITLGAGSTNYQEPANGQPDLTIDGQHYSAELGYANYHPNGFLFELTQQFGFGPVNYQNNLGLGNVTNAQDTLFHTRLLSGLTVMRTKYISLIPYLGLGYRRLDDNLSVGSIDPETGSHFPLRTISYLYTPIGSFLITQLTPKMALKTQFEYDLFWQGNVTTDSFDVDGIALPQVTNTQTQGYGLRGSIDLLIPKGRMLFSIGPYVRYWNIKESNTVENEEIDFIEPANSTLEIGGQASIIF